MIKGLSILVFALNEEKKILSTLKLINSNIKKVKIQFEIIVINDGSTDKTIDIIKITPPDRGVFLLDKTFFL